VQYWDYDTPNYNYNGKTGKAYANLSYRACQAHVEAVTAILLKEVGLITPETASATLADTPEVPNAE
jgi:hypothetical protein